jgi:hypothetical protein
MERAAAEIAKAIRLKPDAHFGRETYQLQAMRWIIERPDLPLGAVLKEAPAHRSAEGLAGLVVLGNAWESVDVFQALVWRLHKEGRRRLAYLAELRMFELVSEGRRSLMTRPGADAVEAREDARKWSPSLRITGAKTTAEQFRQLRAEADRWQAERTAYMMERLREGRHPDIDPVFWKMWHPGPPPPLETDWRRDARENFDNWTMRHTLLVVPLLVAVFVVGAASALVGSVFLVRAVFLGVGRVLRRGQ